LDARRLDAPLVQTHNDSEKQRHKGKTAGQTLAIVGSHEIHSNQVP
jgi:hypothetical protein